MDTKELIDRLHDIERDLDIISQYAFSASHAVNEIRFKLEALEDSHGYVNSSFDVEFNCDHIPKCPKADRLKSVPIVDRMEDITGDGGC